MGDNHELTTGNEYQEVNLEDNKYSVVAIGKLVVTNSMQPGLFSNRHDRQLVLFPTQDELDHIILGYN